MPSPASGTNSILLAPSSFTRFWNTSYGCEKSSITIIKEWCFDVVYFYCYAFYYMDQKQQQKKKNKNTTSTCTPFGFISGFAS